MRKTLIACVATALLVGGGTATAAKLVTSADVKDGTLAGVDVRNGSLREADLAQGVRRKLNTTVSGSPGSPGAKGDQGPQGPKGDQGPQGPKGVADLESDGPYPGRPDDENNLQNLGTDESEGAQSTDAWVGDSGATLQQSWVMCPRGKTALGGGFGDNDGGGQENLSIVTSAPTQIDPDTLEPIYAPIDDDEAGSFRPNAWLVEGYNTNASGELIVRPHVVCARIAD